MSEIPVIQLSAMRDELQEITHTKEAGIGRSALKGAHSLTAPAEYAARVGSGAVGGGLGGMVLGGVGGQLTAKAIGMLMKDPAKKKILEDTLLKGGTAVGGLIGAAKGAGYGARTTRMSRAFRIMPKAEQKSLLASLKGKTKEVAAPVAAAMPKGKLDKMKGLIKERPVAAAGAAGAGGVGLGALLS